MVRLTFLYLWSPIIFSSPGYLWAGQTLTALHPEGFTYDFGHLVWGWRIWGFEGAALTGIVVVGMCVRSVYGRYHFVPDLPVGVALRLSGVLLTDCLILA